LAGLGAFHGLNPRHGVAVCRGPGALIGRAAGWFSFRSLPIALGHALAIAVVVYLVVGLGQAIDAHELRILTAAC